MSCYRSILAAAIVGLALSVPGPAAAKRLTTQVTTCSESGETYINSSGHVVPSPKCSPSHISGATARCRDGSESFSEHHAGTCSHHGGVAGWYR